MGTNDTVVDEPPPPPAEASNGGVATLLARVSELGSSAQASIPGLYAWAVTVAPAAWSKGAGAAPKIFAILGVLALAGALAVEVRFPRGARIASVWGLTLTSAIVWALTPAALTAVRLEATRGLAGMLGWALFAFASAAPAIKRDALAERRIVEGAPLRPRTRMPKGDTLFMGVGALVACILQVIGWQAAGAERAVLVRLVCLASGIAVLGAATTIALARHSRRLIAPRRLRLREALPWLVLLAVLVITGGALQLFMK
jgi:hypothetical protein